MLNFKPTNLKERVITQSSKFDGRRVRLAHLRRRTSRSRRGGRMLRMRGLLLLLGRLLSHRVGVVVHAQRLVVLDPSGGIVRLTSLRIDGRRRHLAVLRSRRRLSGSRPRWSAGIAGSGRWWTLLLRTAIGVGRLRTAIRLLVWRWSVAALRKISQIISNKSLIQCPIAFLSSSTQIIYFHKLNLEYDFSVYEDLSTFNTKKKS